MADTKRPSIRVSPETHSRLEDERGKQSQAEYIAGLFAEVDELKAEIEKLKAVAEHKSDLDLQLDTEKKTKHFIHLGGKKLDKQPYYRTLVDEAYTEQELVDKAIEVSGKRLDELIKDALLSQAKEEITRSMKREYDAKSGKLSVGDRLYKALAELTKKQESGEYRPKFGRINISGVAKQAEVDYKTAVKWAEANQPELLETGRPVDSSDDSNDSYDMESTVDSLLAKS